RQNQAHDLSRCETGETIMASDASKASVIRAHNELGGPTSTNLSRTLFAFLLTIAVGGALLLAFGH
ncbi:MAG: hypothetical protein WCA56_20095, partial [Xanthobacteraceae bacterium]